ncbi:energy transducer TonB [Butyricimonas synergistica]|uniref:energy transducer TonB n=1 Tax=Butyricimonas synergistica TaxID=544644 RepID=UPI0022E69AC3|nr:energy transducer TonB [Butyricimonas synergistica]
MESVKIGIIFFYVILMCIPVLPIDAQTINTRMSNLSIITNSYHIQPIMSDYDIIIEKEHDFRYKFDELLLSEGTLRRIIWYRSDKQILRVYENSLLRCYEYDERGKLVEAAEYRLDDYNPRIFFQKDFNGRLTQCKKIKYQYNDKEQISTIIEYTSNGDAQKRVCKYDNNGRVNLVGDTTLKFDNQGRVIGLCSTTLEEQGYYYELYDYSNQQLSKYSQGYIQSVHSKVEKEVMYEYENDENGNWITRRGYVRNDNKIDGKEYISVFTREYHKFNDWQDRAANVEGDGNDRDVEKEDVDTDVPRFPGCINKWLAKHMKYPVFAQENNIQGTVVVQFMIEKDSSITDVKIVKSVDPILDKEVIRLVKIMPKWIPGKQKGEPVRESYTMPFNFRLQ